MRLLRDGVPTPGGVWADLGSGDGAFTLALADLLGHGAQIYSVDREAHSLERQEISMTLQFPEAQVTYLAADYTRPLELPPLDGIVMANSLHFQRAKEGVLSLVRDYLKPGGHLLLVEYNADHGNMWVPVSALVPYLGEAGGRKRLRPDAAAHHHTKPLPARDLLRREPEASGVIGASCIASAAGCSVPRLGNLCSTLSPG